MRGLASRILLVVLALAVCTGGSLVRADDGPSKPSSAKKPDYYELMKEFVTIFEQIERNYVKDVDRRVLIEAAIEGMVKKLDPYSNYIAPKDLEQFNSDVEQRFGGIGIQVRVDQDTKRLTVITPIPGSPAYKGGVKAGDVIEEIEGKSTKGFNIDDAVKLLKGKAGEPVTIGVRHLNSEKVVKIKLVRAIVELATVRGDHYNADGTWNFMLDDKKKIGYVRLTHFSRRSGDELKDAMKDLKKHGMKSLVLDLRNNPGGLLSQATEIADMFISEGRIVSIRGKNTPERVYYASKPGTYAGFKMAVLVNRYSASASEILSACLQDHKRAVVIGERTWGKGSVQNVIRIPGASSALKLTTASYHRPSGKNIHRFPKSKDTDEWGVMPDKGYRIRFTTAELLSYYDYRRDRDVVRPDGPPKSSFKDRQLEKAVEYVTAKANNTGKAKKAAKASAKAPANPKTGKNESSRRDDIERMLLPAFRPRVKAA